MRMKRTAGLLLAASLAISGCAQFMVPTSTGPLYSAAERDAFYSSVNTGVANTAIGITLLYMISQIVGRPISESEMRERWVPAGVRAYVEHLYVSTSEEEKRWRMSGRAVYTAHFSRTNNRQLFNPAAQLGYFCKMSGGGFALKNPNKMDIKRPHEFRPTSPAHWDSYPFIDPYRSADAAFAMIDAQEKGAWGYFTCTMPDGNESWWADVTPSTQYRKVASSSTGFSMNIMINVHETPQMATSKTDHVALAEAQRATMREALHSSKPIRKKEGDVVIEAWSESGSYPDRFGCKDIISTVVYGDKVILANRGPICLSQE